MVLLIVAQTASADAAIRPMASDVMSTGGRFTSGVVGSLTLRAMLLSNSPKSPDGGPIFRCECVKISMRVHTERSFVIEKKTYCE